MLNEFCRICPNCSNEIFYKRKPAYTKACLLNTNCPKCARIFSNSKRKGLPSKVKGTKIDKNNRKPKTVELICQNCLKSSFYTKHKIITFCIRCKGKNNNNFEERLKLYGSPMKGKTYKDYYETKYSKEEAEIKLNNFKNARSLANSGEKNPQFGQPPHKSSVSYSCSGYWYDLYFRSFYELSFLVWFKNRNGYLPESAETNEFKILLNNNKNYYPDFYDRKTGIIYEIKPFSKLKEPDNIRKFEAAKKLYQDKFIIMTEKDFELVYKTYRHLDNLTVIKLPKDY